MQAETKVWDKEAVLALIAVDNAALARSLWNLYQRQTSGERSSQQTIEHNGRGFNSRDAEFLSDVARRLPTYDFNMTPAQRRAVRNRITKYWRQMLEMIEEKGGSVDYGNAKKRIPEEAKPQKIEIATPLFNGAPVPADWGAW